MKVNELMVDNWVLLNDEKHEITAQDIYDLSQGMDSEIFQPMKLNKELLIELGFTQYHPSYRFVLFSGDLAYDVDDNCIRIGESWEFGTRPCVHQLQNLIKALL